MQPKKTTQHGFLSFYRPYKGLLAADLLCSALVAVLSLALPMCVRYITKDVLEAGSRDILSAVLPVTGIMLAVIVLKTCFGMFQDYKGHDMGAKIERDMRHQLFAHYQKLSFDFFDNHQTGQLLSRMTNDTTDLAELYHHGPENLVVYGTQFIGAFVILLGMNARLTLLICAILPVMAAYSFIFYRKLQKSYAASREEIGNLNAFTEENLSGIRVVKSFTNEAMEINRFRKVNGRFYQCRRDVYKKEALHYTVMDAFFVNLISIAVIVGGSIWISGGLLDFPDLIVFILYSAYLLGPIPKLAFMVQQYQEGFSGYRRFREILDTEPTIKDSANARELRITQGLVAFDNVSFKYSEGQDYILRNLSLEVKPGETVALVGVSGIGKTTLCSLIPRFYEAESGEIRIDGIDIRDVTQSSLRRQIGVVSQNTFLFAGTVMENILYGNPGAAVDDAIAAAKAANAHDFILRLSEGYNTYVGEKGVMLSGGQKQRISIARVFLKNPPILIFDEATSALDYESEKAVMKSMRGLAKGKTTLIIAHRLSTLHSADRIAVLTENGIAEQGTHENLLKAGGVYAGLYNSQEPWELTANLC